MITRIFSPAGFAGTLLCFFLTFIDVRCNDLSMKKVRGVELVTGTTLMWTETSLHPKDESKFLELPVEQHVERNLFAIVALVLATAGLVLSFLLKFHRELLQAVIGLAGVMCMLLMRVQLDASVSDHLQQINQSPLNAVVAIEYKEGYWITLLLFALIAFININEYLQRKKTGREGSYK